MKSFSEIEKWFDSTKWDMGYLTMEQLKLCSNKPIKYSSQSHGWNMVINGAHSDWMGICNAIVFIKHSITAFDYLLYEEAKQILINHGLKEKVDWGHVYTNFKEAIILSGKGVRARNALVYNHKFGFDSKICVIGFMEEIQNPPKIKRIAGNNFKEKYWNRCIGCDDCMKACPVGAIHNTGPEDLYWLDSATCDNFIMKALDSSGKPSHERKFWQKLIPRKHIKGGKEMTVPVCRECQVQPRCSNWDGKYPYEKDLYVGTKLWWLMRNFFDQRMKNRDPHGVPQLPQKE